MADAAADGASSKKKASPVMTIAAVAIVTLVGAGGGWVLGNMITPQIKAADEAKKAVEEKKAEGKGGKGGKEEGLPKIATAANGIIQLEPITTNLAYPSENWVRLEVALMFNGAPDAKIAEDVHQDIMAFLRTVSLQQIQGPRGFQYLRDDLKERVDLRSEGRVSKVMFRTFVIE